MPEYGGTSIPGSPRLQVNYCLPASFGRESTHTLCVIIIEHITRKGGNLSVLFHLPLFLMSVPSVSPAVSMGILMPISNVATVKTHIYIPLSLCIELTDHPDGHEGYQYFLPNFPPGPLLPGWRPFLGAFQRVPRSIAPGGLEPPVWGRSWALVSGSV